MTDYVQAARATYLELGRLQRDIEQQFNELEEFITGRRRSAFPLGKKLLINVGLRLDEIRDQIEFDLSRKE